MSFQVRIRLGTSEEEISVPLAEAPTVADTLQSLRDKYKVKGGVLQGMNGKPVGTVEEGKMYVFARFKRSDIVEQKFLVNMNSAGVHKKLRIDLSDGLTPARVVEILQRKYDLTGGELLDSSNKPVESLAAGDTYRLVNFVPPELPYVDMRARADAHPWEPAPSIREVLSSRTKLPYKIAVTDPRTVALDPDRFELGRASYGSMIDDFIHNNNATGEDAANMMETLFEHMGVPPGMVIRL